MMKPIYYSSLSFLLLSFFLIACKKDKEEPKTKTMILAARPWKVSEITIDPPYPGMETYAQTILGSLANSEIKFNTDGTYKAVDKTTQVESTGTWKFTENETRIIIEGKDEDGNDESYELIVEELTEQNIKLSSLPYPIPLPIGNISITVKLKLIPA